MRKILLSLVILSGILGARANAGGFFNATEIWGSMSFGSLLSGFQLDMPRQTLAPAPDNCSAIMPMVGIRSYLVGPIGLEASAGFGMTTANFSGGYSAIRMYDFTMVNLGLVGRYAFRLPGSRTGCAILAGAGADYSFLSLADAYTSLFSGFSFYKVLSDVGWYARTGISWYPTPGFFLEADACYYYVNARFDVSGKQLDGAYLLAAVSLGFAF